MEGDGRSGEKIGMEERRRVELEEGKKKKGGGCGRGGKWIKGREERWKEKIGTEEMELRKKKQKQKI